MNSTQMGGEGGRKGAEQKLGSNSRARIITTGTLSESRRGTEGGKRMVDDQDAGCSYGTLQEEDGERGCSSEYPGLGRDRNGISEAFSGITCTVFRRRERERESVRLCCSDPDP